MPDAERAKVLARTLGIAIIIVLYALGGLSLYLRAHYLQPSARPTDIPWLRLTATALRQANPPGGTEQPVARTTAPAASGTPTEAHTSPDLPPTPTLYPTITPRPADETAENSAHTERATAPDG